MGRRTGRLVRHATLRRGRSVVRAESRHAIRAAPLPSQQDGAITTTNGTTAPQRGVLGKWKYAADYDVFFGVISPTAGNVWVYKPVGWAPP